MKGKAIPARYRYDAVITKIHDGDTMTFALDLGCGITKVETARLSGVQAPELKTDAGKRCLEELLKVLRVGQIVSVETIKGREFEKWRRLLAIVRKDEASLQTVNQWLVENGLATPAFGSPLS